MMRTLAPLLALLALLDACESAGLSILATGDWGGVGKPPYFNDVQMANANVRSNALRCSLTAAA